MEIEEMLNASGYAYDQGQELTDAPCELEGTSSDTPETSNTGETPYTTWIKSHLMLFIVLIIAAILIAVIITVIVIMICRKAKQKDDDKSIPAQSNKQEDQENQEDSLLVDSSEKGNANKPFQVFNPLSQPVPPVEYIPFMPPTPPVGLSFIPPPPTGGPPKPPYVPRSNPVKISVQLLHFAPSIDLINSSKKIVYLNYGAEFTNVPLPRSAHIGCGWRWNNGVLQEVPLGFAIPDKMLYGNSAGKFQVFITDDGGFQLRKFRIALNLPPTPTSTSRSKLPIRWSYCKIFDDCDDHSAWIVTVGYSRTIKLISKENVKSDDIMLLLSTGVENKTEEEIETFLNGKKEESKLTSSNITVIDLEYIPETINGINVYIPSVMGYDGKAIGQCVTLQDLRHPDDQLEDGEVWVLKYPCNTTLTKMKLSAITISATSPWSVRNIPMENVVHIILNINGNDTNVYTVTQISMPNDPDFDVLRSDLNSSLSDNRSLVLYKGKCIVASQECIEKSGLKPSSLRPSVPFMQRTDGPGLLNALGGNF